MSFSSLKLSSGFHNLVSAWKVLHDLAQPTSLDHVDFLSVLHIKVFPLHIFVYFIVLKSPCMASCFLELGPSTNIIPSEDFLGAHL